MAPYHGRTDSLEPLLFQSEYTYPDDDLEKSPTGTSQSIPLSPRLSSPSSSSPSTPSPTVFWSKSSFRSNSKPKSKSPLNVPLPLPKRRWLFLGSACLAAAALAALAAFTLLAERERDPIALVNPEVEENDLGSGVEVGGGARKSQWDASNYLLGPPTRKFRDNLRPDTQYLTSWLSSGWTNDVMTIANLIHLSLLTHRTPVLPPFTPSHIGGDAPPIPVGEVFNLSRLSSDIRWGVLEWHQVKEVREEGLGWVLPGNGTGWEVEKEEMGCWNIWEAVQYTEHYPRRSANPRWLGLDLTYTSLPPSIKLIPNFEHDKHVRFADLVPYTFPQGREEALERARANGGVDRESGQPVVRPAEGVGEGEGREPEVGMACFDYLYYVCASKPFEFEKDYSPAWREVTTYMHWTDRLQGIADGYVREALGVGVGDGIPPYIAIHARHGDFSVYCPSAHPDPLSGECFASPQTISTRVKEIQSELLVTQNITVPSEHVIVLSDEKDEAWWDVVTSPEFGWKRIDHEKAGTVGRWGRWYPVLVDAVIQGGGVGFVGTRGSTMSLLAERRVVDWRGGVVRMVEWGKPGADEH